MATVTASILLALMSAGIMGWGDQYLILFLTGVCIRTGLIEPVGAARFLGDPWFMAVVAVAWALTTLPSLVPHNSLIATGANAISGPVSLFSGGLFALASAGVIAHVRPELATSLYLLTRDPQWTNLGSYHGADFALLAGGATVAGTLTAAKFAAKPGIALKTGTFGHLSPPLFALSEAGSAIVLTPLVLSLERTHPVIAAVVVLLLIAALLFVVYLSFRWLRAMHRGFQRFLHLLDERPALGFAVLLEFVVPGTGSLAVGNVPRGVVLLALWAIVVLIAFTGIGLLLAVPAYFYLAETAAVSLFRRISREEDAAEEGAEVPA
jgi:hypothetical protein